MNFKETITMVVIILPFIMFAKVNQINELPFLFIGFIIAKITVELLFKKEDTEDTDVKNEEEKD